MLSVDVGRGRLLVDLKTTPSVGETRGTEIFVYYSRQKINFADNLIITVDTICTRPYRGSTLQSILTTFVIIKL
jgi:hypothetical protein